MNVNKQELDIVNILIEEEYINQRQLAKLSGHSLGVVNKSLKRLLGEGYLNEQMRLTEKAVGIVRASSPKRAVILAAGYGMRMVPINTETPKALLEVNGEVLIERTIKQLHSVGIKDIQVIVGFMKERFEYLIDAYDVKLIVNREYGMKNNLHSLKLALGSLDNCYIIPCDIWCDKNPFSKHELYSWYMVTDLIDSDSNVRVNRRMELSVIDEESDGNAMIGISYLLPEEAEKVRKRIQYLSESHKYDNAFWEESLFYKGKMILSARLAHSSEVVEINTYEQLRELDSESNHLRTDAVETIMKALDVEYEDIVDIEVLKKGMTNRSFLFTCKSQKYIMRIPGEGTDQLINRKEEADVYNQIREYNICDSISYINSDNGYKITEYIENARVCDTHNNTDLELCMDKLREMHSLKLKVNHTFDLFGLIDFYESLWPTDVSLYKDYVVTKKKVLSLKSYIESNRETMTLTHIDAVPDNFLILPNGEVRLIDWEYAGMQDPHLDVAMFCIYSLYEKSDIDKLIQIYFKGEYTNIIKIKIYCYIAVAGLLWSNWCEYKSSLGIEFGEYSLRQYRYAKEYYQIAMDEMKKEEKE